MVTPSPLSPGVLTLLTSDCAEPGAGSRGRAAPTRLLDSGHQHTPPGGAENWFLPGGGRKGAGKGGQVKRPGAHTFAERGVISSQDEVSNHRRLSEIMTN